MSSSKHLSQRVICRDIHVHGHQQVVFELTALTDKLETAGTINPKKMSRLDPTTRSIVLKDAPKKGASDFVGTFLGNTKTASTKPKNSIWTGNFLAYKIQAPNPTFAGTYGSRSFYKIQIMEIHLLWIGTKNLVQIHLQKLSQKQLHFVGKTLFAV